MRVCEIPHNLFLNHFLHSSLIHFFFLQKSSSIRYKFYVAQLDKKLKEMSFKAVLGDLEGKIFFHPQLWWVIYKISFAVIFVRTTHESFFKS